MMGSLFSIEAPGTGGTLGVPPPDAGVLVSDDEESYCDLLVGLDESDK